MRYTPKSELELRTAKLQEKMRRQGIDGAVLVQNADLFYFTGNIQQSHLFIPAEGQPVLMVKRSLERAREESALANIVPLESLKNFKGTLDSFGYGKYDTLGFELDVLPTSLYLNYQKLVAPARVVDVSPLVREVRMVKSAYEIGLLREVAKIQNTLYDVAKENLREGITELELSGKVAAYSRKQGHAGLLRTRGFNQELYYLHITSGNNVKPSYFLGSVGGFGVGPSFSQGASSKQINRNEPILADMSFVYDGYLLDQTRIYAIGQLAEHFTRAHAVSLEILRAIEKKAVPGVTCGEVYNLALEMAKGHGLAEHFLGYPENMVFVGHGVGIELDELPVLGRGIKTPLEQGMILAIEPKFVFPDGAVGIENDYLVTENGLEDLTQYQEEIIYV